MASFHRQRLEVPDFIFTVEIALRAAFPPPSVPATASPPSVECVEPAKLPALAEVLEIG